MMMGSWMGSHFTNDDLVKESRLVDDYEIEIAFEGETGRGRGMGVPSRAVARGSRRLGEGSVIR